MKTIVVGAGAGGLASALLASLRGEDVTLIEAHAQLGGCASYFDRGPFSFDVGATTLSGLGNDEPLGRFFEILGSYPEVKLIDPGIVFYLSSGKIVRYFTDFDAWMKELEGHFPGLDHRVFWELVRSVNERSWRMLKELKSFPFRSITDVVSSLPYLSLLPHLLVSTDLMLKKFSLDIPEYLEMINGILIISAQATASEIPFLVGAMGLSYPASTYAPKDGMKGLMKFFEEKCKKCKIKILTGTRMISFTPKSDSVCFKLHNLSVLSADRAILNLPIWNIALMDKGDRQSQSQKLSSNKPGHWGAVTFYLGVRSSFESLYQQVHLDHPRVKNYFVSFSIPEDISRAPSGWQAVSISIHVSADEWQNLEKHDYETLKKKFQHIVVDDFLQRFEITEFKYLTTGSPRTFERYTGRKSGFVGGLPFLYGSNPLKMTGHETEYEKIFKIGDTVFPGQGLCGVVAGALMLDKKLRSY